MAKVHMDLVRNGFSPKWISSEMDIFRNGNSPTTTSHNLQTVGRFVSGIYSTKYFVTVR